MMRRSSSPSRAQKSAAHFLSTTTASQPGSSFFLLPFIPQQTDTLVMGPHEQHNRARHQSPKVLSAASKGTSKIGKTSTRRGQGLIRRSTMVVHDRTRLFFSPSLEEPLCMPLWQRAAICGSDKQKLMGSMCVILTPSTDFVCK